MIILSQRFKLCVVWVTIIIVFPCVLDSFFRVFIRFCSVPGSSPDVGSSRKNSFGSASNSTAMLALFFCPPLSLRIYVALCSMSSTISSTFSIRSARSALPTLLSIFIFAVYSSILLSVRFSYIISCCGT